VYLLGGTLLEILTGAPPHGGRSLEDVLFSAFTSEARVLTDEIPEELAALCNSALARDPMARPTSAMAFGDALDDYARHRGSRTLARTGEARLARLRALVEDVPADRRDLGEVRRLIAEARFAFHESRRAWNENPAVAPGLAATLSLAVRAELDRRDVEAACAMLHEFGAPPPELVRAVDELAAEVAREAEQHSKLEKLARDLDPEIESTMRVVVAGVVLALVIGFAFYTSMIDRLTPTHVFGLGVGMLVALAAMMTVLRRRITRTVFNRRMAAWVSVGAGMMVAHRAIALFDPYATPASILTTDLVLIGAFWAFGSIFIFRWMLLVGIGVALCAIPTRLAPSLAPLLFTIINALSIATFLFVWRRRRPAELTSRRC
jgi:eukaryotic-like serine/threonine-protein kinase